MSLQPTYADGTGRAPRPEQIQALDWVSQQTEKHLVMQLATGIGKSFIARCLQLKYNAAILTPSNVLLDQYSEIYPKLNFLKGADHYTCPTYNLSCADVKVAVEICGGCKYSTCRKLAMEGAQTVFNPLSYNYSNANPKVMIIDEAHKLLGLLRLLISARFSKRKYAWDGVDSLAKFTPWLRDKIKVMEDLVEQYKRTRNFKKAITQASQAKRLTVLAEAVERTPEDFILYVDGEDLVVEPVDVPRWFIDNFFKGVDRIILLSATIPKKWATDILGKRSFAYLDVASPIPKDQRKIVADAANLKATSNPSAIAVWVKQQMERYPGNAILHVTYAMGRSLVPYFPDAFVHTPDTKSKTMDLFKRQGGLWIAAGSSEGIDLPGDCARLNLVPYLPFASTQSPLTQAKLKRDSYDYYLDTAITFVQQVGRTTRGIDDSSVTVCGDSRLSWLLTKVKKDLPKSFVGSIIWK
jgi:Rad3-related DNA helicase